VCSLVKDYFFRWRVNRKPFGLPIEELHCAPASRLQKPEAFESEPPSLREKYFCTEAKLRCKND
jgi:hypothetical protein